MCLRDFDWIKNLCYFSIDKFFNRKSHVGVSIGIFFLILILFKQLLSVKICLGSRVTQGCVPHFGVYFFMNRKKNEFNP